MSVERRGRRRTTPLGRVTPRVDGQSVIYDRPGLQERYEVRETGVEQSFVIDECPPGNGDLVVRGKLVTDLVPDHFDQPVRELTLSAPGQVGVHIGAVTGIDANDNRATGTLRQTGEGLELILPADFVDRAHWPLIVDPLIGSTLSVSPPNAELPDVAFDATNLVYVAVWRQKLTSGSAWRPYYRFIRTDGSYATAALPLMPIPQLVTYFGGTRIRVANVNSRDTFVATWDSGSGSTRAIHCASISAANFAASVGVVVASGSDQQMPDVGGEAVLVDDDVVLTWRNASLGLIRATQVNVPASTPPATPIPFGPVVSIAGSGSSISAGPAIARTGGGPGRYLVTWGERSGPFNTFSNLRGLVITRNVTPVSSPFTIVSPLASAFGPRNIALDGDGEHWVVAYDRLNAAGDTDVYCQRVELPLSQGSLSVQSAVPIATTSVDEQTPAVADLGESYLVSYERSLFPAIGSSAELVSIDPIDCTTCEGSFTIQNSPLGRQSDVRIASTGGAPNTSAMIVWGSSLLGSPLGVRARMFAPRVGIVRDAGRGCGAGGTAVSTCSVAGNANYTQRLLGAAPSAPTFLVIGLSTRPQSCGPCQLIPDPASGVTIFRGATSASGDAFYAMSIPPGPAFVGLRLHEQWITLTPQPRCTAYGFDLSNALSVTIQ
ncbi:MAG: hypothetical protein NXI31_06820 [bacterium]|nr:hypothetical protein [bacterium]